MQEVALLALLDRPRVRGCPGLIAWAREVAPSLADAQIADEGCRVDLADLAERAGAADVPWQVSRRMALDAVLRHLAAMPDADRAAVLAGLEYGAQASPAEARDAAVRRFRARQQLAKILRRFGFLWFCQTARRLRPEVSGVAVAVTATAAAVLVAGPFVVPSESREALAPVQGSTRYVEATVPAAVSAHLPLAHRREPSTREAEPVTPTRRPSPSTPPATVIDGPAGTRVQHREEEKSPDDPLLCVWAPVVGTVCTPTTSPATDGGA